MNDPPTYHGDARSLLQKNAALIDAFMASYGRIAPPSAIYDVGVEWVAPGRYTIQMSRTGRLFVVPLREEETVTDKAVELLVQRRFEEAQERAQAEAEAIVEKVTALNVTSYGDGAKVVFTKLMPLRDGTTKTYTYLALRVVEGDKKLWFVTGQPGGLADGQFESLLARDGGFGEFMGWGADARPREGMSEHTFGGNQPDDAPLTSNFKGAPVIATDDAVAELPDEGE
jgi:hypothetical protein